MGAEYHYAIADLHLGHERVLQHDNRPFDSIAEHDEIIARNCASVGRKNRTLWLLGDLARTKEHLVEFMTIVRPHWGKINLLRGNHDDRTAWQMRSWFDSYHEAIYLRISPTERFYLSHYAHRTWRNSHHGAYHLHGHSHGALKPWGRSMDVGANCIGYTPLCFAEAIRRMEPNAFINHHDDNALMMLLSDEEMSAVRDLMLTKDMPMEAVFRQALRLYQAVDRGAATIKFNTPLPDTANHVE